MHVAVTVSHPANQLTIAKAVRQLCGNINTSNYTAALTIFLHAKRNVTLCPCFDCFGQKDDFDSDSLHVVK